MANTGTVLPTELQFFDPPIPPGTPTGEFKANTPGEIGYIAPYVDTTLCPITYSLDCPGGQYTGYAGYIRFMFSPKESVLRNPNVSFIRISAMSGSVESGFVLYALPNSPTPNLFDGSITSLSPGSYTIRIAYYNSSNVLQSSCTPNTITVT